MKGPLSPRRLPPKLLVLSPGDLTADRLPAWLKAVKRCVDAGLMGLLLREPDLSDSQRLYLALQLAKTFKAVDGFLALHDAPHLAAASGVDAVHLGFRSLPEQEVRRWLPDGLAIGLSTHQGDEPVAGRGDYSFYGPVFETPSKVGLKDPVGLEDLKQHCAQEPTPVWGLGGIDPSNAGEVLQCGVAGLAVKGAVWNAKRPWRRIGEFQKAMGGSLD